MQDVRHLRAPANPSTYALVVATRREIEEVHQEESQLASWVERTVRGTVTRVERMPRWRPAWDVDVEVDGHRLGHS